MKSIPSKAGPLSAYKLINLNWGKAITRGELPDGFCQLLSLTLSGKSRANLDQVLEAASLKKMRQYGISPWIYYWLNLHGYEDLLSVALLQELRQDLLSYGLLGLEMY